MKNIKDFKNQALNANFKLIPCNQDKQPSVLKWQHVRESYHAIIKEKCLSDHKNFQGNKKDENGALYITQVEKADVDNIIQKTLSDEVEIYGIVLNKETIVIDIDLFSEGQKFESQEDFEHQKQNFILRIQEETGVNLFDECSFIVSTPGKVVVINNKPALGGGYHCVFRKSPEYYDKHVNKKLKGYEKVDIRSYGHYIVGQGSKRGGGFYAPIRQDMNLNNLKLLPSALNEYVYSGKTNTSDGFPICESFASNVNVFPDTKINIIWEKIKYMRAISGESGNDITVRVIHTILDHLPITLDKIENNQFISLLERWNKECAKPSWDYEELMTKVRSILSTNTRNKPVGYLYSRSLEEKLHAVSKTKNRTFSFALMTDLDQIMLKLGYSFKKCQEDILYKKDIGVLDCDVSQEVFDWKMLKEDCYTKILKMIEECVISYGVTPTGLCSAKITASIRELASRNVEVDKFTNLLYNLEDWDNKKRLSTMFQDYLYTSRTISDDALKFLEREHRSKYESYEEFVAGMQKCYDAYHEQLAKAMIMGIIYLSLQGGSENGSAGAKLELVPVFLGPQGVGKSTTVKYLNIENEFYNEITLDQIIGPDKDIAEKYRNCKILEWSENAKRSEACEATLKSKISKEKYTFRLAYRRDAVTVSRWFYIIVTSNKYKFLSDSSGNRRFFPVQIGETKDPKSVGIAHLKKFKADIRQIYAEAFFYYKHNIDVPFPATQKKKEYCYEWGMNGDALVFLQYLNSAHFAEDNYEELVTTTYDELCESKVKKGLNKCKNWMAFRINDLRQFAGSRLHEARCSKDRISDILERNHFKMVPMLSINGKSVRNCWIKLDDKK